MSKWGAYVSSELRKLTELELFYSKLLSPVSIYLWIKGVRQLKERRNLKVSREELSGMEVSREESESKVVRLGCYAYGNQ